MTKMAVYQPRRAAIATILVAVMQDDIREELVSFLAFLTFSLSASLSSEYSSKLLFCCSSQDDGKLAVAILH